MPWCAITLLVRRFAAGALLLQRAARPKDAQPARPARILAAINRTTANIDCDHIPAVLTLEQSTGKPVVDEGHGGTTMVSRLGDPAIVDKDGSITAAYRPTPSWPIFTPGPLTLRRIDAAGRLGNLIDVPVTIVGAYIRRLTRLSDGALLVSGGGDTPWIAKLNPSGQADPSYGTNGVATPTSQPGYVDIIGQNPDGSTIAQAVTLGTGQFLATSSIASATSRTIVMHLA